MLHSITLQLIVKIYCLYVLPKLLAVNGMKRNILTFKAMCLILFKAIVTINQEYLQVREQ